MKLITKKLTAFTLAETLIVMGIIGIVATLTIPSLTNSTNSKDTVAKVKKAHANLEDAFGRMIGSYGEFDEWTDTLTSNLVANRLFGSMKLTKTCGTTAPNDSCFKSGSNVYDSSGANTTTNFYQVIQADGISTGVMVSNATCTYKSNDTAGAVTQDLQEICGTVTVDIDGPSKGKNKHGQDMFTFYLTKRGIYPVGSDNDARFKNADECTKLGYDATKDAKGCTAWVVYNNNMDYKKAGSDAKCKTGSGKTLTYGNVISCD